MENLAEHLLYVIDTNGTFNSDRMAALLNIDHQAVVGAVKSLERHEGVRIIISCSHYMLVSCNLWHLASQCGNQ